MIQEGGEEMSQETNLEEAAASAPVRSRGLDCVKILNTIFEIIEIITERCLILLFGFKYLPRRGKGSQLFNNFLQMRTTP